jgi:hypothetical protein
MYSFARKSICSSIESVCQVILFIFHDKLYIYSSQSQQTSADLLLSVIGKSFTLSLLNNYVCELMSGNEAIVIVERLLPLIANDNNGIVFVRVNIELYKA